MSWYDGELFPVAKEFVNAPVGVMIHNGSEECEHIHTVAPKSSDGGPANTKGRVALYCMDCMETWWEPAENIQGSPWAVAK